VAGWLPPGVWRTAFALLDGTERPVQRPKKPSSRKAKYSGKKKRHTAAHQLITDDKKRILVVGPAHHGCKHDKRIYDEIRIDRPPDILALADLGSVGTTLETPLKTLKKNPLTKEDQDYNTWHSKRRIGWITVSGG